MGILMDYTATPATTTKPVGENGPAIEGFALDPSGCVVGSFASLRRGAATPAFRESPSALYPNRFDQPWFPVLWAT